MQEEIKVWINEMEFTKKRPLFVGRQAQMMKADLALRVARKKREMEAQFAKYGGPSAGEFEKMAAAQLKRERKAARRLKEKGHE